MDFIDISAAQGSIDWRAYRGFSSVVAMKSTEGIGYTSPTFAAQRQGAQAAGIDAILYYHYGRPDLGNDPAAEANYMHSVVGAIRESDLIILDYEVGDARATADWAYRWLAQQTLNYGGKLPGIYAATSYIQERLQDARLAKYPLWLAQWTYNAMTRPACPSPWQSYAAWQFSDAVGGIPGVPGAVDCNIFFGTGENKAMTMIPLGWHDDGATLTAPDGHKVVRGFRDYVLGHPWDPGNVPLEDEQGVSQVELHTNTGPGTRQIFRDLMLIWTAKNGVKTSAAGAEIAACYQQIAALKAAQSTPTVPANVDISKAIAALATINTGAAAVTATIPALKQALGVQ